MVVKLLLVSQSWFNFMARLGAAASDVVAPGEDGRRCLGTPMVKMRSWSCGGEMALVQSRNGERAQRHCKVWNSV